MEIDANSRYMKQGDLFIDSYEQLRVMTKIAWKTKELNQNFRFFAYLLFILNSMIYI